MGYDVKIEFGKQAKKFRLHFGLSQMQVADLSGMSPSEYSDLEHGVTNYNVGKLQSVSSVYGLFYYQMGNPKCRFPIFSKLPEETKNIIISREQPLKVYSDRLIVEHLILVFSLMPKYSEFLIKDINIHIKERFKTIYENEEISGTINKKFLEFIIKTDKRDVSKKGPGAKPFYYRLIKSLPKEIVGKAKEKVEVVLVKDKK